MAIKELKDINQRPRYFAGQFLLEDDFELEQDYARDRLQRYTRSLHVSGIADGLIASKPNDPTLKLAVDISAGTAIDRQGRQVVLLESRQVDLSKDLVETVKLDDGSYILSIRYDEQETEPQDGNTSTNRRILENPAFKLSSSAASDDFMAIAKLTIKDGIVSIADDSNSVRKYTGWRLPGSSNNPLTLRSEGDRASNLAVLSGSLSVSGILRTQKLQLGNKFLLSGDGDGEVNDEWLRLKNPDRPAEYYGGFAANKLWCAALEVNGLLKTQKLEISGNLKVSGNIFASNENFSGNLSVTGKASIGYNDAQQTAALAVNGNVGIGTTDPGTSKLKIANNQTDFADFDLTRSGMGQLQFVGWRDGWNINTLTDGKHLYLNRDAKEKSDVWIGRQGKELFVRGKDGNVGIGTISPTEKLDVSGNIIATGSITGNSLSVTGNEGIQLINTAAKGKPYGIYSGSDGTLHIKDLIANSDRIAINSDGIITIKNQPLLKINQFAGNSYPTTRSTGYPQNEWFALISFFYIDSVQSPPKIQLKRPTDQHDWQIELKSNQTQYDVNWLVEVLFINIRLFG
jgi:hypothetical protein